MPGFAGNRIHPITTYFYRQAWDILQKCNTIVISDDKKLENSLTQAVRAGYYFSGIIYDPKPTQFLVVVLEQCVVAREEEQH